MRKRSRWAIGCPSGRHANDGRCDCTARPVEPPLSALQRFRLLFPRDAESHDVPPFDWQRAVINAVRELDRKVNG